MKKTLLTVMSIVMMLFSFIACSNDNKVTGVDESTAQSIADNLNLNEFVNEVFSKSEADGVKISYILSNDNSSQASLSTKALAGYTLTATVEFDGFEKSSTITIESGVLKYLFKGTLNGSIFSAESYSIETVHNLNVVSGTASSVEVSINVNETEPTSTTTVFRATLASVEAGETTIAAGSIVSVGVSLPEDASEVIVGGQPVEVPEKDDESSDTPVIKALTVLPMDSSVDISNIFGNGITVDNLQSNVTISNGVVTGCFNYAEAPNWGVDSEDEGYYLCVSFDVAKTSEVTVNGKTVVDTDWALFLGSDPEAAKAKTFTVSSEGKSITIRLADSCEFKDPESPFAGGRGTENSPYLISNAAQFLAIGSDEIQTKILNEGDIFFKLTDNIDLTSQNGYVAEVFSGTLDGNGKTIYGSNNMPYFFHYALTDAAFKNFKIIFDTEDITRLFGMPALSATKNGDYWISDKDTVNIEINDVDYSGSATAGYFYEIDDTNGAVVVPGASGYFAVYNGTDMTGRTWIHKVNDSNGNRCYYHLTISGCDVEGNFTGGYSAAGVSIFLNGKLIDSYFNISDSTFKGVLEGYNTGLVIANSSDNGTNITASNVTGDKIISYSGKGSLSYANSKEDIGGVSGSFDSPETAGAITVGNAVKNGELSIDTSRVQNASSIQIKLLLPSLYWYDSAEDTKDNGSANNSNPFTIIADDVTSISGIYVAKPISRIEAEALKDSVPEFASIDWDGASISKEGLPFVFIQVESDWYLVVDYTSLGVRMYSDKGLPSAIDDFSYGYAKNVIVIASSDSNKIMGTSNLISIS